MQDDRYRAFLPSTTTATEDYDLGRSIDFSKTEPNPAAPINRNDALKRVKEAFDQDRAFAEQVVRTLGWPELLAARPKVPPRRMPMLGIRAIECSISHSPPRPPKDGKAGKPRRSRVDRDALPYYVTIQVFDAKSKGLSDPAWRGAAQLRTPERARIDARKKDKLTSLSSEYAAWIEEVIVPAAEQQDMYVGFLMDKQAGQGTYFHEFQVIFIHRESIESRDALNAMIVSKEDGVEKSVTLPKFDTKASKGPLKGTFVLQSRGATKGDLYTEWKTGSLTFT